jgi:hypothetical protein
MRGGRILWDQIAVVLIIVVMTTWAATQWTAWRLGFQAQLGTPWFELAGLPIYYPPIFFWWWFSFDAYAPAIFTEGAIIAASGGLIAIAAAILMSIMRAREARNVATYGSARWAQDKEICDAGLLGPQWRRARPLLVRLSAPRRPGACAVLRADPERQGRRPPRADAAPRTARPSAASSRARCSYRAASSPSLSRATSSRLSRGGRSSTASLAKRSAASCRAVRCRGSWGIKGGWNAEGVHTALRSKG